MAEQSWTLGASVLLERWNGCSMIGRGCTNAVGDVLTQNPEGQGPQSLCFGAVGWRPRETSWVGEEVVGEAV